MSLTASNLYAVQVAASIGVVGSFFAAALDNEQARAIGEEWAGRHDFRDVRVSVKRYADPRPVYVLSAR